MKLSMAQTQVFIDQVMNPNTSKYNMGGYMRLVGDLDCSLFIECVHEAISFNDAFRVEISGEITAPEQKINDAFLQSEVELIDFGSKGFEYTKNWIQDEFRKPMEFIGARLYQAFVLKVEENEHWLVVKIHHAILDGYGFAVFLNRIASNYMWLKNGTPLPTSFHTPFSFIDAITEQSSYLESNGYERDELYWRERMCDVENHSLLNKEVRFAHTARMNHYELSSELNQNLLSFCQRTKNGIQDVLMSACAIYFHQKSGATDICFGTPIHGRRSFKEKNTVGLFVHLIPVRLQLNGEMKVLELISTVQGNLRSDYRHSRFPLRKMFEFSGVKKPIGAPPFEVVVKYDQFDVDFDYGQVEAEVVQIDSDFTDIPMTIKLKLVKEGQPHVLSIQGRTDIFSNEELDEISTDIFSILNQISFNSEKALNETFSVSHNDRDRILTELSSGLETPIKYQSIVDWFDDRVVESPDLPALYYEGKSFTFQELNCYVNFLAGKLINTARIEERFVGILQDRSHFFVISILAVLKAGYGYLPLDPAYPNDRLTHMIADANLSTILYDSTTKELVENFPQLTSIDVQISLLEVDPCDTKVDFQTRVNENRNAYLIYTSGSTGVSKGVVLNQFGLCNVISEQIRHFHISTKSRILQFASFSFDASVSEIFTSLLSGACLYILPARLAKESQELSKYVESHQITHATLPPAWLNLLNPQHWNSLQVLVLAGESFSYEMAKPWISNRKVLNAYGPTEGTICTTIGEISGPNIHIGRPIANVKTYVLDEYLRVVPKGSVGELYIAGAGLAEEYLNREELNAEKFFFHSFAAHDADPEGKVRLYRTGDLVKWTSDGNLEYVGRKDRQVKIRGFRIELDEIEHALCACRGVTNANVSVTKNRFGENSLVAYLIKGDVSEDVRVIQEELRLKLPEHMIPSGWMLLDQFPLTINGKVDTKKLPIFVPTRRNDDMLKVPHSHIEKVLAGLWKEILDVQEIFLSDHFFEVGGDSISATRLVAGIARELDVQINVQSVFNLPTLQELADYMQILSPTDANTREELGTRASDEEDMESFEL